ncbi:mucin-5B [Hylobates moloch]|uniref:mucin-5B n=1 Tax=Hylobates moloch TaxID=81572 RepID=UPI0013622842|nr:mucin-5B [Hylobates moloch]
MGAPSACRTLVLALAAVLVVPQAETQGPAEPSWGSAGHTTDGGAPTSSPTRRVSFVPPVTVFPSLSPLNPAHNGRVCSTWGDFHYKTFDGDVFHFPGLCNYVFSEHCGVAYEDFNVQLRRGLVGSRPVVTRVVIKAQGLVLEASNGSVLVNGQREELPYSRTGLLVEQSGDYVKVSIRLVLTFLWNGEDSALLELDPKYANQTCGLCGDFNGLPTFNEFYAHNSRLTPLQFGNLQKLDGPTEQCPDPLPLPAGNCTDEEGICHRTLLGPAFAECHALVDSAAYLAACAQDLCRCPTCPCATFVEYSRQCAHAGGQPRNWRRPELCPRTCPLNMQHQECGSPCADTCSNPQRAQLCEDHCVDGCFCPPGTVLDDITHSGCLPLGQCPCTHSGRTYSPGTSFNTTCSSCTCSGGLWQCQDLPCPGTCSVQGGAHISTYDEKLYDLHGDCSYVLSKKCADGSFTVLAELRKCGLTDNENCLKAVTLSLDGGDTAIRVQADGGVFLNSIYTQLPLSAANITLFTPSSFFIVVQTGLGLQLLVQLVPLMQVFVRLDSAHQGQMCGLCGNFNQNQADDFTALSGVVEATGAAFANTWKAQAACANARNSFEDPCSLSVENENYARHWCSRLTDPNGAFSRCHSVINPKPFHSNCMFDTCNCERSEDCLCAALSSYVHACAAKGVQLSGWRDGVCTKYMQNCPKSQRYAYVVDACQPTCRGLSEADVTCSVSFVPVDGCTCPAGTFLNDAGACVPAQECPCYVHGTVLAPGEVVHDEGAVCSCTGGKLSCLGASLQKSTGCTAPMVYLDCSNSSAGTPGAECLRSCHTLDVGCFSTHCVSGCVCPPGLVSDGSGGCIAEEDCPCVHNEATYKPGETIRVDCNTCTCRNRRWECSHRLCLGTCVAYGDGHFITFDGERYSFEGSCEYILAQDYCGDNTTHGTFRIVTENIPCGTTGTTCSKAIKLFVESYELILQEGTFKAVVRGPGGDPPYKIRYMGIFLVIETRGMAVSWDRKTSVFIRLHQDYKGRVCGLCGNFDDNAINDFATRSRSVVGDALEFGNSWKLSPSCPDSLVPKDPCTANPFRKSWAQKQCSILHGPTFAACRSQVDSTKYYEACVNDACACDSGGDCECFCTAVAAYAQACHDAGLCVSWRTPDTCPLFCDFYNPHGSCEWHYQPCGAPCLKTCRNPSGHCLVDLPGLEGCYPKCPPSQPFFNEDQMKCVAQCGCYDKDGNYYDVGARVPTAENCQSCNCTPSGIQCAHSLEACTCTYEDRTYSYQDVIYNTTDGLGACLIAICGSNGTIIRKAVACPGTPATTPFTFTTAWVPHPTTSPALPVSTVCVREFCHWSSWYNGHRPEPGLGGGDFETFENLRQRGYQVCPMPADIECRAGQLPDMPLEELGQQVDCDRVRGLMCANSQQSPPLCHDYELRVLCCEYVPCGPSPAPGSSPQPSFSASTEPAVPTPTQTTATEKTTLWVTPSVQSTAALTSQTGSSSGPVTVTPPAPGTTTCQPRCQWTEWFDEDYPKSEQLGGDVESYDKIKAAGGHLCQQPKDIECQAESFPNWTLAQVGQKVHCDVRFGLVCRNWEQEGVFKMCYNYRIRVLCCSADHCRGRATTPPPATEPETATTTTTQALFSTPQPTSSPGVTRAPLPSTTAVPTLSKGLTSPRYTSTLGTATTGGPTVPAASTEPTVPGVATSSLPTRSALPATTGSSGTWRPSQPSTLAPTTMATSRAHPTGTASTGSKEPLTTSLAPTLTSKLSTSRADTSTPRAETTLTPLTEATTSQGTTHCQPKCEWTEWFDVDFPTSGVAGGDMETFENIKAAGGKMCWAPKSIECRAENYPEVSIDQVGQVLTCSLETGLTCKNEDQTGRFNMCFNYNVRVLCCDDYSHCPSTAAPTPTSSTQAPKLTSTGATTPTVTASTATTAMVATTPTATATWSTKSPAVTGPSTLATTQTGPSFSKTTERVSLPSPSAPPASTTSLLPTRGQQTSQAPSMPTSATVTSTPTTSPMVTDRVHTTLQTSSSGPTIRTTLPSGPPSPSTGCVPRCTWTDWFDADYPSPGPDSGDFETFGVIRSAGHTFCEHPQDIECRSEMEPDQPLEALGQVVQCDVSIGLVCRNRDQLGPLWYCHNFHVRLLCCDDSHCATTPTSTRSITTTPTRTGSMAATSMSAGSTAATPRSTGATARRATTPGTAHTTKVLTTTGITTQATSSTATPYSTQRTAETPKMLTTTTTRTVAASSTATPFATVQTAHTPKVLTTTATTMGSTVTPSNSPGTASTLPALITTTTTPKTTISMVTPSSIPGTTHTPAVLITTTMTTVGTGSMATPTSSPQTAGTPTELTTTATKITATGSTTNPSSTPRTTPIPLVLNTTAITPAAPSTAGTTNTLPVLTTTSTTHGQSQPPSSPHTVPTVWTSMATLGTTHITEPSTVTSHTPAGTTGTTLHSTPILSSPHPSSRATESPPSPGKTTLGLTTATSRTTATTTPSETRISTLLPSSPTSASTTLVVTTGCEPQCAWSDWLDYSYPMPGPSGGDFDTYSNIRAAGGAVCEQPLGLECRAQAQPGVPLRELGQIVECSLDFGLVCRNREQVGKFKMCFNYEIRVFCCNYSLCPSTPATSSTATASSTPGTTWILTELTTTGTTTAATGSSATPSSTPGTTWILTEPTTPATTTVATGSTATPSSTPGTTWILTEPTTTAITTVAAGSTATLTSTPVTAHPPKVLTSTATTPIASSSKATPSSSARTTTTLPVLTSTATKSTATSFTPIPSSTLWTTWTLPAQTTTPVATMSTIHTSSTPETTHTSTVLTTTATTTRATSSTATSSSTLGTTWVLTELTSAATTTAATGSTATPSSTPETTWILTEPSTTATMIVPSGSMATASSTPGTGHTPKVVTTMATMPTATGSTVPSSSTLGTTHTPAVLPSSLPTFSMSTVSSSVLTTLRPTGLPSSHFSTPCFCRAFGQFFSPGEVIYNKTDRAGCHFYAVCNQHCDIDRFQGACPTSPAPVSSTPLSSPSPAPGCDNAIPPRQVNETWTLENCMVARCVGDNHVILLDPKPVANVTCVNKHLPIKVSDPIQPCDFHYECECICSMWGGSHYSTFDGTSYTFRGNCTYVLMREIHARFGNLSLYLDNNYCAASATAASCPRALSIHYKSMDIVLTVTMVHGKEEGLTLFDKIPVSSGFSKNGVLVSVTGTTTMRVDIPALGVSVTFDGHVFQARLPYSLFHNNTEGQCGTCTNNQRDDCLQRDGTTAASCKDMAKTWLVPDSRKDGCWAPTGTPPTASPPAPVSSTPTPSPCPPQPLCDLMLSQVFAECHDLVPPGPFFNACISDHCGGRPEVPCQSLEAYAALCRTQGVCSDWRGATGGLCDLTCPPTKVYKPCGRIQPATCNSRNQNPQLEGLAEGCFCPEDQILFNAHTGICVQACPCVGPDGFPKFPGERWVSNCQSCVCDEGSVSVQCKPLPCEAQGQPLPCSRPGFVTVTRPRADNPCCPETVCVCDTTTCPQSLPVCPPGQELICTQEEGDCCPTFRCRPQLCSYNGTFYGVGATFPGALPCHTCTCLSGDTQDPTVQCQEDACNNTTCPQGFEYKRVAGQCCGECMQTACLTPDGQPVQLNETWVNSRVDNCTVYLCEVEGGVHLLTPQPASCPDVSSCRGSLRKTGCCYSCEEDSCQVHVNMTVLWHQGCETEVNITFCEGSCPGVSKYLAEAQAMQHQCTCCQERRVHEETVPLRCPDGSAILHTYTHVDECGCTPFCVPAPRAPPHTPGFLAQEATAV